MELWNVYGCKSDCEDAPEYEVEQIKCMLLKRREKQAEDDKKQQENIEKQKREVARTKR